MFLIIAIIQIIIFPIQYFYNRMVQGITRKKIEEHSMNINNEEFHQKVVEMIDRFSIDE